MNLFEQLIIALRDVHEHAKQIMRPREEEGLSHGQLFLLFMIHRRGTIKTTDISHYFDITPGAATSIADKLESWGLIQRERDKKDRRVVVITLSEKGLQFINCKKRENTKKFEEILKDFSTEELHSVINSLNKITSAMASYQSTQKE